MARAGRAAAIHGRFSIMGDLDAGGGIIKDAVLARAGRWGDGSVVAEGAAERGDCRLDAHGEDNRQGDHGCKEDGETQHVV